MSRWLVNHCSAKTQRAHRPTGGLHTGHLARLEVPADATRDVFKQVLASQANRLVSQLIVSDLLERSVVGYSMVECIFHPSSFALINADATWQHIEVQVRSG